MWQSLRFPSPLIEPDVPISGIRLSDWFHREAHGVDACRARACARSTRSVFTTRHSPFGWLPPMSVLSGTRPITSASPSARAHQKSGAFPPPELPGFLGTMSLSDSRRSRRPNGGVEAARSEEHTSELQSLRHLVCRLL